MVYLQPRRSIVTIVAAREFFFPAFYIFCRMSFWERLEEVFWAENKSKPFVN